MFLKYLEKFHIIFFDHLVGVFYGGRSQDTFRMLELRKFYDKDVYLGSMIFSLNNYKINALNNCIKNSKLKVSFDLSDMRVM